MSQLITDLKLAVRSWSKTPLMTAVIILTLALGIGANGAIFSVIDAVVLEPLEYPEPERLLMATSQFPTLGFDRFWISPPEYGEMTEWAESFASMGAYRADDFSVVGGEQPMQVQGANATASLFRTLGVEPARGRVFTEEEDVPNGPDVVVLSWELWQRAFGGDETLVGRTLEVDGRSSMVTGIMPPGFDLEENKIDVWVPAQLDVTDGNRRGNHFLLVVGRLKPDRTLSMARAELETLLIDWQARAGAPDGHFPSPDNHRIQLAPLHEEVIGDTRPALYALLGAVGFVLLIACANVANILLARSEVRQKEMAVRTAMGAPRVRLVRQLLTESVLLSVIGGAVGLMVAQWGLQALLAANPESLPRADDVRLDGTVVLASLGIALLTGLLFGAIPALRLSATGLGGLLKEGAQRSSAGRGRLRGRALLVVAEMALAVALVVGSGLMIKSLSALVSQDAGFDATNLTTYQLYLPSSSYPDPPAQSAFLERVLASVAQIPGVTSVSMANGLPPKRDVNANDMEFEGVPREEGGPPSNIDYWQFISPAYLETMDVRVLEGRGFLPSDDGEAPKVALVNQRAAQTWWPDQSAVGRRLRPGFGGAPWFTIVGVLEDVKQAGLDAEVGTEVYWNFTQAAEGLGFAPRTMNVLVRSTLPTSGLAPTLRETVWSLDPSLPVANIRSMDEVVQRSVSQPRFLTLLLTIFGTVALFLAAIGIYGILSYSVSRRSQELGIRMAMGADRRSILGLVLSQGLLMAGVGLVLGVVLSLALSRVLQSLLWGVSATDPMTYAAVVGLLGVVALLACVLPALRATRVDPLTSLRYE